MRILNKIIKGFKNKYEKYQTYYKNKNLLDKNLALKDKFKGQRCFIIGNGPSIGRQDLRRLAGEETFVLNTFYNHPQFNEIRPKNYLAMDSGAPFFRDELFQKEKFLSQVNRLFFNLDFYDHFKKMGLYTDNRVHYLHIGGHFKENLNFNIEIHQTIPRIKNVVIASIMTAVYMGFEEIYLLGCEHSFLASPRQFEEEHFLGISYFVNPKDEAERKYYAMHLKSYEGAIDQAKILFQNYRFLKAKIAKTHPNVKIYNATPNSFLDVFPYVKYESIFR